MPTGSVIYHGRIRHRRLRPRRHAFSYGVYHVLLDLDDLDRLDAEVAGFGHNRPAVTSFWDRDHLGGSDAPVRAKLSWWLATHGVPLPGGPVRLLTNLRVLGHAFNPVSWYFCHDRHGRLSLIVAEVSNTFGESYGYVLDDLETEGGAVRAGAAKRFHVSPFMDIQDHHYSFAFDPPGHPAGERLAVGMQVHDTDGLLFEAALNERRRPLTTRTLWWTLLRYPLMTLRTVAAIHWQAARLWLKRIPVVTKPDPPDTVSRIRPPIETADGHRDPPGDVPTRRAS